MKVSILTVVLDNADTIKESVHSLVSQKYEDIEHIVQDGGSTDKSCEIISNLSPKSLVISEQDNGIYDALNKAFTRSSGNIIGILHADDLLESENVISNVIKTFESTNCDAIYGDLKYVDRQDPKKVIRTWISGEYEEGDFLKGWMPPHPTFFVKREVIEKYGNYNLSFKSAADYEWMLRLIHKHKIKLSYLPEFLVSMRVGGKSNKSLKNRILANLEDRRAWKVNGLKPYWYTLWLKPLRKISQYFK